LGFNLGEALLYKRKETQVVSGKQVLFKLSGSKPAGVLMSRILIK
jgi:hypothetical protein